MGTRSKSQSPQSCCRGRIVRDRGRGGSGQGKLYIGTRSTRPPRRPAWPLSSATLLIKWDLSNHCHPRGVFSTTYLGDNWVKLWYTFWGKEDVGDTKQQVTRGPDPVGDSLFLPDVVSAECDVMIKPDVVNNCWNFRGRNIFIQYEYKEAEEFALSARSATRRNRSLMVTGQPGIGSSLSISPSPTQVSSSFIRDICLSSPHAFAPPCIQTSNCTPDKLQLRPPF